MSVGLQSFFLQYVVMLNINVQSYTFDWFGFGFWPCMKTSKPNHKCKKKKTFMHSDSTYLFIYQVHMHFYTNSSAKKKKKKGICEDFKIGLLKENLPQHKPGWYQFTVKINI